MTNVISRRVLAGVAAATLALGVTACSDAEDSGDSTSSATSTETSTQTSTSTASSEPSSSAAADGESVEVETASGESVLVPGAFAEALTDAEGDWGQPDTVEEGENGAFVATYANGDAITYSEETGAVELVGEIGNTWAAEGGLGNPVGLPTAPETEVDGGWTQDFQNGTISWLDDGTGTFSATVEQA